MIFLFLCPIIICIVLRQSIRLISFNVANCENIDFHCNFAKVKQSFSLYPMAHQYNKFSCGYEIIIFSPGSTADTITVHAPHPPVPHPNLLPVRRTETDTFSFNKFYNSQNGQKLETIVYIIFHLFRLLATINHH